MHYKKTILEKIIKFTGLLLLSLLIAACSKNKSTVEEKPDYPDLPTVEIKYNSEDINDFTNRANLGENKKYEGLVASPEPILVEPRNMPQSLYYDSGIDIPYPKDGVKGLYVSSTMLNDKELLNKIIDYVDETDLNSLVIDFKDDSGFIVPQLETDNQLINEHCLGTVDMKALLEELEERQIYPIARIVTFKDNRLATSNPELTFIDKSTGEIWESDNGERFVNPFLFETWDYNIQIAEEAAKMGFKDIQFDYIRFPENFWQIENDLDYNIGSYETYLTDDESDDGIERIAAINDFLVYAKEELAQYGVDVSCDIFGYSTIAEDGLDVRGIGQNFTQMAQRVDVVSAMIYPSHWTPGFFGIDYPDLHPYEVVDNYLAHELPVVEQIQHVTTRPWIQDFTQGTSGAYMEYGPQQVQDQIDALYDNGVNEYLIWNATGDYNFGGIEYAPTYDQVETIETFVQ